MPASWVQTRVSELDANMGSASPRPSARICHLRIVIVVDKNVKLMSGKNKK
jgi:hypothetical protein